MAKRAGAPAGYSTARDLPGAVPVRRRAALDLTLVGLAAAALAGTASIGVSTALTFATAWIGMSALLGAYEVEYRLVARDALASGLLIAVPAAGVAAAVTLAPQALLLGGLAPMAAIPLTIFPGCSLTIDQVGVPITGVPVAGRPSRSARLRIRLWDILGASIGLSIALPFIAAVWLSNLIWAPGPLLFRQDRVGHRGRVFGVVKCRTMVVDADRAGAQWASVNDPRVTRVGRVLRRTRIDELPQLWNVVRGEMSIVGPRPEQVPLVEALRCHYPTYEARHQVRPGLTGLSQVCVGYTASVEETAAKLALDLYYVAYQSVGLNFAISARTVRTVLTMAGR